MSYFYTDYTGHFYISAQCSCPWNKFKPNQDPIINAHCDLMYISYALASDWDDIWMQYQDNIVKRSFQPPRGCTQVTADWRAALLRPPPAPRCPGLTFRPTPGLWVGRLHPRTVGWSVTDSGTVPLLCGSSDKSKADSVSLLLSVHVTSTLPAPSSLPNYALASDYDDIWIQYKDSW